MQPNDQLNRKVGSRDTKRIKTSPFRFKTNTDVNIYVSDLAKAEEFYGETLGFRQVSKSKDHLEYDSGALRLNIFCGDPSRLFIPSIDVNDLAGASRYLENAGCILIQLPGGELYFRDPFGLLFELVERPRE